MLRIWAKKLIAHSSHRHRHSPMSSQITFRFPSFDDAVFRFFVEPDPNWDGTYSTAGFVITLLSSPTDAVAETVFPARGWGVRFAYRSGSITFCINYNREDNEPGLPPIPAYWLLQVEGTTPNGRWNTDYVDRPLGTDIDLTPTIYALE